MPCVINIHEMFFILRKGEERRKGFMNKNSCWIVSHMVKKKKSSQPNHTGKTAIFQEHDQVPAKHSTAGLPWQEVQTVQSKIRYQIHIVNSSHVFFFLNLWSKAHQRYAAVSEISLLALKMVARAVNRYWEKVEAFWGTWIQTYSANSTFHHGKSQQSPSVSIHRFQIPLQLQGFMLEVTNVWITGVRWTEFPSELKVSKSISRN